MEVMFSNGNDPVYQQKLNHLLKDIFLDFQFWYDLNLWDQQYESYSIMQNDEIVSNISVFKTQIMLQHQIYPALSIGSVATKDDYRGKGYSKLLMEHILTKYDKVPMYLSANDSVIDFYPRFGFRRIHDKQPVYEVMLDNSNKIPCKLSFNDDKVFYYVKNQQMFSKKFDCLNTQSINMFHIHLGYLKEFIYELPEIKTMIIAEQEEATLKLIGAFSAQPIQFSELLENLPFVNVKRIEFGFTPPWSDVVYRMIEYEADPMFVRNVSFDLGDFKFPELSVT